mgnify:CR=1 FL=1
MRCFVEEFCGDDDALSVTSLIKGEVRVGCGGGCGG